MGIIFNIIQLNAYAIKDSLHKYNLCKEPLNTMMTIYRH